MIKKLPDFKTYQKNPEAEKIIVQKSGPLQLLSETNLTLAEFKIIDVYLGKINSHDPQSREITFTKGEIEKLLGLKQIREEDLKKRLKNLFQTITLQDPNRPNGFCLIALFAKSEAWQNENGLWEIRLKCTDEARKYIFNIENIGYIRYRLHNILNLTSRYSYILFLYLENNRFREKWKIGVDALKKILNCCEKTYDKYYLFNSKILKTSQKELNSKTSIKFEYTGIKIGRSVKIIEFNIISNPPKFETDDFSSMSLNSRHIENNLDINNSNTHFIEPSELEKTLDENLTPKICENVTKKVKSLTEIEQKCAKIFQKNSLLTEIKEKFSYNQLVSTKPQYELHINFAFQILYEVLASDEETIKIKGVEQKIEFVQAKLLKLKPEEILYVVEKYSQLDDVKNPESYMLSMLYCAAGVPIKKIDSSQKKQTSYDLDELLSKSGLYVPD